MFRWS